MIIEPVKNYKTPAYPTIERYVYNPQEFLRHAPHSWLGNAAVWTALVAFSLNSGSCARNPKHPVTQTDKKSDKKDQTQQKKQKQISFVAPVFIHGEGISAFGCEVVAPPVIISEQDAMEIIKNEFAKHNILFEKTDKNINIEVNKYDWRNNKFNKSAKKIEFDAYNADLDFVFEYISSDDFNQYGDDDKEYAYSSVSINNYKALAEKLQKRIKKEKKLNAVVFYDPVAYLDREDRVNLSWDEMEAKGKGKSKELLIQQVTDFIEWLKKEKLLTE